jgi:hypothetical protein
LPHLDELLVLIDFFDKLVVGPNGHDDTVVDEDNTVCALG